MILKSLVVFYFNIECVGISEVDEKPDTKDIKKESRIKTRHKTPNLGLYTYVSGFK